MNGCCSCFDMNEGECNISLEYSFSQQSCFSDDLLFSGYSICMTRNMDKVLRATKEKYGTVNEKYLSCKLTGLLVFQV